MNLSDFDWPYIRRFTTIPLVTAALSVGAMCFAIHLHKKQVTMHEQLFADHEIVQEDYDALVDRRRIVDRYHRRYQLFSEQGFVGMESRLDWIETLRSKTDELTLPRVSYVMDPQLTAIAPVTSYIAGEDINIHVSKLNLEMSLVHEVDLLRFVDELQQHAPGLIQVDACGMTWQGNEEGRLFAGPNILANCNVRIYSVITSDVSDGET